MENDNFIAIQENKPEINWFVVILMSLYSQLYFEMKQANLNSILLKKEQRNVLFYFLNIC